MPILICQQCGRTFEVRPSVVEVELEGFKA